MARLPRSAAAVLVTALTAVPAAAVPTVRATDERVIGVRCDRVNTLRIDARATTGVVVRPARGCRTAVIDGAAPVNGFRPVPGRPGVWAVPLRFRPAQVTLGGRLLAPAHSPRGRDGNPWIPVRAATGAGVTLPAFPTRCTSFAGATLRVRASLYEIEEATVTGSDGFTVDAAGFAGTAGWGAYLEGPECLLDEPGEWAHDGTRLLVQVRRAPVGVRAAAPGAVIDARDARGLRVERVAIRGATTGILAEDARGLTLDRVRVTDAADHAVNAECAEGVVMRRSTIARTGRDGLHVGYCGRAVTVTGSSFTDVGTVSSPRKSEAAVFGGFTDRLTVTGSTFRRTGYIAVRGFTRAVIARNRIRDACVVLEDCGAVYLFDREAVGLAARIEDNLITGVRGNPWGRERGAGNWWRDGLSIALYLDDRSGGVTVRGNTLADYQYGMQLHGARDNLVEGNRFTARDSEAHVFMNDDIPAAPRMAGNVIRRNVFAPTSGSVYRVHDPDGRVALLATYSGNTYGAANPFAEVGDLGSVSLARWRAITGDPG